MVVPSWEAQEPCFDSVGVYLSKGFCRDSLDMFSKVYCYLLLYIVNWSLTYERV